MAWHAIRRGPIVRDTTDERDRFGTLCPPATTPCRSLGPGHGCGASAEAQRFQDTIDGPLINAAGGTEDANTLCGGKVKMVIFSADVAPVNDFCLHRFVPFCQYLRSAGKVFEVIFVSDDPTEEGYKSYLGKTPFWAIPFTDTARKQQLRYVLGVNGPAVVVIDEDGEVITTEGEQTDSEMTTTAKMLSDEQKKVSTVKTSIVSQEKLIDTLAKKEAEQRKTLEGAGVKVEAARKALALHEAAFKKQQEESLQIAQESLNAVSKLSTLRTENERAREAVTLGEKSLMIARQQSAEARKLLNPLNHPRVAALMGRK
eukprot:gene20841-27673_t